MPRRPTAPDDGFVVESVDNDQDTAPVIGPAPAIGEASVTELPGFPRLARHKITLADGQKVSLAVCGRGVPLVLVHGFTAEGMLYAQTLSRLVARGFKVVAIDTAGHGGTLGLPTNGNSMEAYTHLLARVVDELGIRKAVFAGHSMGGRLVTELAASEPDRVLAVVLLDAIVGDTWDRMVNLFRVAPPLLVGVGAALAVDTLSTLPMLSDPRQAAKLGRLLAPTVAAHARRPWRMVGPAVSILRSKGTGWMLDRIAQQQIPLFVIHGDHDVAVPMATAVSAARRGHGELVRVHKASHSWLLKDPQTLPAIFDALLDGRLGQATRKEAALDAGLPAQGATLDQIEAAFYEPDALVVSLTPAMSTPSVQAFRGRPRYRFTIDTSSVDGDEGNADRAG